MVQHLDENALAQRLRLSPRTLQRWRPEGKGPVYLKVGGRIVYRLCDVESWEEQNVRRGPKPSSDDPATGAAR